MTEAINVPHVASRKDLRNFGFTFGAVAAVVATLLLWRGRTAPGQGFLIASTVCFAVAIVVPGLLRPFFGPWMKFAEILGYVNTRILLAVFYYVGITPTGVLMRLAGKDPMTRTFKGKNETSYWTRPAPHVDGRRHFDRQF